MKNVHMPKASKQISESVKKRKRERPSWALSPCLFPVFLFKFELFKFKTRVVEVFL